LLRHQEGRKRKWGIKNSGFDSALLDEGINATVIATTSEVPCPVMGKGWRRYCCHYEAIGHEVRVGADAEVRWSRLPSHMTKVVMDGMTYSQRLQLNVMSSNSPIQSDFGPVKSMDNP
jgi:hypothetical protein